VLHNLTAIPWGKASKRKLLDSVSGLSRTSSQETVADTFIQDSPIEDTLADTPLQDTLADTLVQDTPLQPPIEKSGISLYLFQKLYVNII